LLGSGSNQSKSEMDKKPTKERILNKAEKKREEQGNGRAEGQEGR
jgi:hypothetical protein